MDKELKEILERHEKMLKENNQLLHKMHRFNVRQIFWKWVRRIIILLLMLGAYWAIKPFIDNLNNSIKEVTTFFDFGTEKGTTHSKLDEMSDILEL